MTNVVGEIVISLASQITLYDLATLTPAALVIFNDLTFKLTFVETSLIFSKSNFHVFLT